jgi:hypothetical protein
MATELKMEAEKTSNALIYAATAGSILLSLATVKSKPWLSNFFGLWAPTIVGLGILAKENQLLEKMKNMAA